MFKRILKLIKKNEVQQSTISNKEIETIDYNKNETIESNEIIKNVDIIDNSIDEKQIGNKIDVIEDKLIEEIILENIEKDDILNKIDITYSYADMEFIKDAKIRRGKSIKSINLYTREEEVFKTHNECSKKLKVPIGYIKENLKFGYTDYLGEAIMYLNKELQSTKNDTNFDYLKTGKNPMEIYNNLNDKIFSSKISERKREYILSNQKIEPINMHYTFECIDSDYDDYFYKYKSIIQRGGKKKIELIDKKGEAIEIFKSLDECSSYLNKQKSDIVNMLKYGETKTGRYEIRYSLRNI